MRANWVFYTPSGAVDACASLGPSAFPIESRCSMPGGGTEAAVVGSIGAVLGRFAAEAATPVRISCALLYWSVLLEMTTVGSLYSRYRMSFCKRQTCEFFSKEQLVAAAQACTTLESLMVGDCSVS